MHLVNRVRQLKVGSDLLGEALRGIAHDIQTAALWWPPERERCHDQMTIVCENSLHRVDVTPPILGISQEMKSGPIVPKIELRFRSKLPHITIDPSNHVSPLAEPGLGSR